LPFSHSIYKEWPTFYATLWTSPKNEFVIIILVGYDILASLLLIFLDIHTRIYETMQGREERKQGEASEWERGQGLIITWKYRDEADMYMYFISSSGCIFGSGW
jgi:hypothetical protein